MTIPVKVPTDIKAFVAIQSRWPLEADARAEQEQVTGPERDYPYQGLWEFPNVKGTLVHVFSPHSDADLQRVAGWVKR